MSALHIVNKSPFERNSLGSCLRLAAKGSAVLLFEDGVIGAMKNTKHSDAVAKAMSDISFYALGPDIKARGLNDGACHDLAPYAEHDDGERGRGRACRPGGHRLMPSVAAVRATPASAVTLTRWRRLVCLTQPPIRENVFSAARPGPEPP